MKALTLTQPWATLVAIGAKHYETRSWPTNYRGPLAIHAAKTMPKWAVDVVYQDPFFDVLGETGMLDGPGPTSEDFPRGAVIAVCTLTACIPTDARASAATLANLDLTEREFAFGDYSPGRYAWRLDDVHRLPEPIPAKGALGLWEWTPSPIVRPWLEEHYPEAAA